MPGAIAVACRRVAGTFLLAGSVVAALPCATAAAAEAVYRFYNRDTGTHFYTVSVTERDGVLRGFPQFAYEGAAFAAPKGVAGTVPVFRFYNTRTGTHFYTTSESERDGIVAFYPQLAYEGAAFQAFATPGGDGRTAVFRFYNRTTGAHFYTVSPGERDTIVATYPAFTYEGIAFYGYPSAQAASAPVTKVASDAWRFLQQTSFGPTPQSLARVNELGVQVFLEEQFIWPASGYPDSEYYYLSLDESDTCSFGASRSSAVYICARDQLTLFKLRNQFFTNALYRHDQLRQRVAWALSQFFVVSGMKDPDMETAYVQSRYHQILFEEAFGNFESLLERVTRSPQMGHYLDMVNNAKANPGKGTEPNENFARELLQLFSIGTVELKDDGTPLTDARGMPVPTYGQDEVKAFARAFTGWTYPAFDAAQTKGSSDRRFYAKPMVVNEARHDTDAKKLLHGTVLPAGQATEPDLRAALRNVFVHPNVGPFLALHLIRQLVTGNPTPAYVARVTKAFNDNGKGVRGDMKAVLRAILLDAEARGDGKSAGDYGMLMEPVLFVTSMLRQLDATSDGNRLYEPSRAMGQDVYYAPSVFGYYAADYKIPGTTLAAPQFGIHNTNTVLHRANFASEMIDGGGWSPDSELAGAVGTKVDLVPYRNVAGNAAELVKLVDARLFGGGMPLGLRDEIYQAVTAIEPNRRSTRARLALFLAVTSFQYQVIR